MPNPTTIAASLDYDQAAYDMVAYYALRPELYADALATVKSTNQSMEGSSVQFTIQSDLSATTTALNESTDITPVAMADTTVPVTLREFGNAVCTSALVRGTSFLPLDPVAANVVGYNAGLSMDTLAMATLSGGTNISYAGTNAANNTLVPTSAGGGLITSNDVRKRVAALRRANVQTINGYYLSLIHPDVSYDLRSETGATGAWRDPHVYSDPADIWNGEIGIYESVRFLETPRAQILADAGSSTTNTDVYQTLFLGQEALAKAHSHSDGNGSLPAVVPGPVTDTLRRFVPLGWYWLGNYAIFRQAAVRVHDTASSIGLNLAIGTN